MATTTYKKTEYSFTPEERKKDTESLVQGLMQFREMSLDDAIDYLQANLNRLWGKNGVAWELGAESLEFFCKFFLQDIFIPSPDNNARELAPFHYDMWKLSERLILQDEFDKLGMSIFRGGAKTTIEDVGVTLWCHCYKYSTYTLVLGSTNDDAVGFLSQIRYVLEENKRILDTFGYLVNSKIRTTNANELELENDTKVHVFGSGTSIRGKKYKGIRPTLVISDDYQNKDDVLTEAAREKKWRVWEEDVKFVGDAPVYRNGVKTKKGTKFIVLGTILHQECYMSRIMRSNDYIKYSVPVCTLDVDKEFERPQWQEFKKRLFNRWVNEVQRKLDAKEYYLEHQSEMEFPTAWPEKYTALDLAYMYFDDARGFKQELMNDAKAISDKWFKSNRIMPKEEIEKLHFEKTILVVDPAASGTKKADYCVFAVMSTDLNDFKYVRNGEMAKFSARHQFDKYCQHFIDYLISYPDITHIVVEKNTFNGAEVNIIENLIRKDSRLLNRDITIVNEIQKRNKENKIGTIVSDVNNGRIIFAEEDEAFRNQVMEYCGEAYTLHDDAPDTLAEGSVRLDELEDTSIVEIFNQREFLNGGREVYG